MPDYRETTVNVVHDTKTAHVWTNNRRVKTRLKSLGFAPQRAQAGGEWYDIPERAIWFKNPARRRLTEAQRGALTKMRKAAVRHEG